MYHHNENNKKPAAFRLSQMNSSEIYSWPFESSTISENVMRFNGITSAPPSSPIPSTSGINLMNQPPRVKRKGDDPSYFPNKQLITEEKMIKHLHGLHLSNDFQAHNINLENHGEDMEACYTVNLSPEELQQRLKNAQCIQLHEDVRKSLKESSRSEIYKVLSNRIEKPCQALVLWQPPPSLERLITDFKSYTDETESHEDEEECEKMLE